MKKTFFIVLVLLNLTGQTQTFRYNITSNRSSIGHLEASRSVDNEIMQIEVTSDVKTTVFIGVDIKYRLNATYKNKDLLYSSVTTYVNDKIHSTSKTEKIGEYYTLTKNGHTSKYLHDIPYSGALLYFMKPENMNLVFSDFDCRDKPVKQIGIDRYQIKNPKNGHLSEYEYQDGLLEKATIHHTLITLTLTKE